MPLIWLILGLAQATKPSICRADLTEVGLPGGDRSWLPDDFLEGGIRPSLLRVQEDVCRCTPRRKGQWPEVVRASVWVKPNIGKIRIEYAVSEERTPRMDKMLACMGMPTLTVAPMPYKSDIVYPAGREEVFPRYPIWLHLTDTRKVQTRKP